MGWLLQVKLNVTSHNQQGVGHHSICLSEEHEKENRIHNKNAATKEAMRKSIYGVWFEMNCDENATVHCCTIILYFTSDAWLQLQRWERAGQSWLRENGKVRTHSKRHCKLNWRPWDLAGKSLFVILLRATMARESWHDFYLRKKGQCFIQVLLQLEHLNDTRGLQCQAVSCELQWLKENQGPLTEQFRSLWKTHFPDTGHHHPEGSCGQ